MSLSLNVILISIKNSLQKLLKMALSTSLFLSFYCKPKILPLTDYDCLSPFNSIVWVLWFIQNLNYFLKTNTLFSWWQPLLWQMIAVWLGPLDFLWYWLVSEPFKKHTPLYHSECHIQIWLMINFPQIFPNSKLNKFLELELFLF